MLAGISPPAHGRIDLVQANGTARPLPGLADAEREGVAWVSGDRKREGIFPLQSVFENFAIGLYKQHLRPFGRIDRVKTGQLFEREVDRFKIKIGSRA